MALKEATVTVEAEGGDKGKVFVITRMDALSADKWGRHVLQAAIKAGAAIPVDELSSGVAGVAALGIRVFGGIDPAVADQLLDQLLQCVQQVPDPKGAPAVRVPFLPSQIDEIETISFLHAEAFKLHVGFFRGAASLFSPLVAALMGGLAALQSQSTSPEPSPQS